MNTSVTSMSSTLCGLECAHVDRVGERDSVVECCRGASGREERRHRRYHQSVHVNEHHVQVNARPLQVAQKRLAKGTTLSVCA
jgi:hypothetical protein